jgi:hypothetical protein
MARSDIATKDVKWEQCYPEEATQRRLRSLREESVAYTNAKRAEQRDANANLDTKLAAVDKLAKSATAMKQTLAVKTAELAALTSKRENLEQYERRERRAFLDNSPQSGTGGAPGVRTTDDRVLLAFWITYGAAILTASIFALNLYGARIGATDTRSKAQLTALILLIAYAAAYLSITYYG